LDYNKINLKLVSWITVLLGLQYLLGGINWWYKIFPFPSMSDPPSAAAKHAVLVEMVKTGWMFYMAKIVELTAGLALLTRRFVPLMLIVSFPVALTTFGIDAMIGPAFWGWISGTIDGATMGPKFLDMIYFGGAVLAMQGYLMIAYLDHYRSFLKVKAEPNLP
jgi:hypothetical protein